MGLGGVARRGIYDNMGLSRDTCKFDKWKANFDLKLATYHIFQALHLGRCCDVIPPGEEIFEWIRHKLLSEHLASRSDSKSHCWSS